jgi:hypothetical protein
MKSALKQSFYAFTPARWHGLYSTTRFFVSPRKVFGGKKNIAGNVWRSAHGVILKRVVVVPRTALHITHHASRFI